MVKEIIVILFHNIINKLKVSSEGKEEDIDSVIKKIVEVAEKGDMHIINELK